MSHWWPAALDVIWHIYSHLHCSTGDGGRESPSSGEAALTMGQVTCEFWADWPRFTFLGEAKLRCLPALPCWGWCIIHGWQLQMWFGTFTHTCTAPQGMVAGTCCLQGRQPLSFGQIGLGLVFQGKSWDKGPSSLTLPRIVQHPYPVAPDVIWHIYSGQCCFKGVLGMDLLSSGDVALTMGQVPCGFQADWPNFIFQPADPDMIWHIYSGQCCFKGVLGMDLLSSGDVALTMGQVPCGFQADWPNFIFQPADPDMIWHIYSGQCCFKGVLGMDLPSFGDVALTMGQVACEFQADWPIFIFQPAAPDVIWHIYSGQCWFKGVLGMDLLFSGDVALTMGQVSCEFWADQPNFIFQPAAPDMIWHIYSHLYSSSRDGGRDLLSSGEAALTMGKVPCEFWADQLGFSFAGEELRQGSFQPYPAQDGASSMASSSGCDLAHLLWAVLLQGVLGMVLLSSGYVTLTMGQVPCEFGADRPIFHGSILPDSLFSGLGPWQTPQG